MKRMGKKTRALKKKLQENQLRKETHAHWFCTVSNINSIGGMQTPVALVIWTIPLKDIIVGMKI